MTRYAFLFTYLFAAVSACGGVLGFVAGSPVSLYAGVGAAILLALGAYLGSRGKVPGAILALVVSVLLAGRFFKTGVLESPIQIWPATTMVVLGVVAAALLALAIRNLRRRA